jgi:HlyD family secretion protein
MRALTLLLTALLAAACGRAEDDGTIHLNGRIEAPTVDLAPKVAGRVVNVLVREGDRVKAGTLLVRLDLGETAISVEREQAGVRSAEARAQDFEAGSRESEISAAQAELTDRRAALSLAEKEAERQKFLLDRKVGTQRDLDRARTELARARAAVRASEERVQLSREGFRKKQTEAAEAEADRARAVLAQSVSVAREGEIRAPADGVILHRLAEPGQLLGSGQAAVTMAFADRLYVRTFIPETALGRVRAGTRASVTVDAYPGREFPARITEIAPDAEFTPKAVETKAERVNLVYAAKADLDRGWNEPLVPGQPAEITITAKANVP